MRSLSGARSSSSLVLSLFAFPRSLRVCKGRVILHPESFCNRPQTGAQQREGDNVVCGVFLCVCVWRSSVGVVGRFLGSLSPVEECVLGCPGLTLPPCVCVRVCMRAHWVSKSFVAESSLNKGSFWIGFQDNQRSCRGWEVLADWRVLKVCSSARQTEFVGRNASVMLQKTLRTVLQ